MKYQTAIKFIYIYLIYLNVHRSLWTCANLNSWRKRSAFYYSSNKIIESIASWFIGYLLSLRDTNANFFVFIHIQRYIFPFKCTQMHFLCMRADVSIRGQRFNGFVRIVARFYSTIWTLNTLKALPKKRCYQAGRGCFYWFFSCFFLSGYAGTAFVSAIRKILVYCAI